MDRPLTGRVILIIEDEPLIALNIQHAFEDEGARTISTHTLAAALLAVEEPRLAAAIVDHALGDGDSSEICQRLKQRNVPFVIYSGFNDLHGHCAEAAHVNKPESPAVLVATIKGLLSGAVLSASEAKVRPTS